MVIRYLKQLLDDVLSWPHIESTASFVSGPDTVPIRLEEVPSPSNFERLLHCGNCSRLGMAEIESAPAHLRLALVSLSSRIKPLLEMCLEALGHLFL